MNNNFMRKNCDISRSYTKDLLVWFLSNDCNIPAARDPNFQSQTEDI